MADSGDQPQTACDRTCDRLTTILIAVIVILVIIVIAYRMRWLNWMLPARFRRGNCPAPPTTIVVGGAGSNIKTGPGFARPPAGEGFVGSLSRTDYGKPTLIFASAHARFPLINLGTYV
jgi:hypothetical protein